MTDTTCCSLTAYPEVDRLLRQVRDQVLRILGDQVVGIYLYGSLTMGDFDLGVSDFDLLVVTTAEMSPTAFDALQEMHHAFVRRYPSWQDHVEILYVPQTALETTRSGRATIAVISPGEPFHYREAGREWLINWWLVRERGITLHGSDPTTLIAPISQREFLETVWLNTWQWPEWVQDMRAVKAQSYARLTLCRALYAATFGEQASKRQAALWTKTHLPQHAHLIDQALAWRVTEDVDKVDPEAVFPETERFIRLMVDHVAAALRGRGVAVSTERRQC